MSWGLPYQFPLEWRDTAPLNGAAMRQLVIYVTILWRTATRPLPSIILISIEHRTLVSPSPWGTAAGFCVYETALQQLRRSFSRAKWAISLATCHVVSSWAGPEKQGTTAMLILFHCLCKTSPGLAVILPAQSMEL